MQWISPGHIYPDVCGPSLRLLRGYWPQKQCGPFPVIFIGLYTPLYKFFDIP